MPKRAKVKARRPPKPTKVPGKPGQPIKWLPEYNEAIVKWFDKEAVKTHYDKNIRPYQVLAHTFPTLEGFAFSIGVDDDTLLNWAKMDREAIESEGEIESPCPGFFGAYTRAKKRQKQFFIEAGMAGALNPVLARLFAINNLDMKDTTDHTNDGGKFETPVIVSPGGDMTIEK